ncbi:calcitonin gene-related peptide type 1 receptor-like isoform X2 [Artemia franciscana]|uniref:Calcitonin receptor n=2 Tax=Artemia franciscana TaxID=6661 RepID=A0AA88HYJ5_ARTSF|nr:hypothetical protein QYM36_011214 [Artemia franciscana]
MSATSFVIDVDPFIIEEIRQNCQATLDTEERLDDIVYCRGTFDGWACWNSTPAGVTAYQRCPFYVTGFTPRKSARRECLPDGTWFRHPESNLSWSNYTTCLDTESFEVWQQINGIYIIGYSISLTALVVALIIYCTFRSLRCTRVEIHKNLFTAFAITNMMFLVWHSAIVPDADLLLKNPIWCQIWHIVAHYFLLSNHLWMLFEGFYLHTILVVTFIDENRLVRWFYFLGWSAPLPFIIGYVLFRATRVGENGDLLDIKACWVGENNEAKWILVIPIIISLLANLVFLINIVRVVFSKLRNMPGGHYNCKRNRNHYRSKEEDLNGSCKNTDLSGREEYLMIESNPNDPDYPKDVKMTALISSQNVLNLDGNQGGHCTAANNSTKSPQSMHQSKRHRIQLKEPKCPCGYKKAVRATFILIPLLGLHYMLVPFHHEDATDTDDLLSPKNNSTGPSTWTIAYQMVLAVTASFQGVFVALLFCLLNAEVIQAFRKKWNLRNRKRKGFSISSRSLSGK